MHFLEPNRQNGSISKGLDQLDSLWIAVHRDRGIRIHFFHSCHHLRITPLIRRQVYYTSDQLTASYLYTRVVVARSYIGLTGLNGSFKNIRAIAPPLTSPLPICVLENIHR